MNAALLATLALWCPIASAQGLAPLQLAKTIGEALSIAGVDDPAVALGAPDLDAPLTSSSFFADTDYFAAAYYYIDATAPDTLTALHVSAFDRRTRSWTHAGDLGPKASGSAVDVRTAGPYLFVELHWGPAAPATVALDRTTLQRVALLEGWDAQPVPDGTFVFVGNMPGMAPYYQEPLWAFDPAAGRRFPVFVPDSVDRIGDAYWQSIVDAHARLPDAVRREYEAQGAIDEFSRSIEALRVAPDGQQLAFVAEYSFDRFPRGYDHPRLETVVRCDRESRARWTCEEREAEPIARAAGRTLGRQGRGWLDEETRAWLVAGALAR